MKLEQAAQALLAHWDTPAWMYLKPTGDLMADLREALDHSGEANEMVPDSTVKESFTVETIDELSKQALIIYALIILIFTAPYFISLVTK